MFIIFQDYGNDHEIQCMDTPNVLWWANIWVAISLQEELTINRWMIYCENQLSEAATSSPGCEKLAEIALAAIKTCLGVSGISAPLPLFLMLLHPGRKGRNSSLDPSLHKGVFIVWFSAVEYCQQVGVFFLTLNKREGGRELYRRGSSST